MHDDTPETKVSEFLYWRDYQSRRRLLRSAIINISNDGTTAKQSHCSKARKAKLFDVSCADRFMR